jgi:glyoxylase-like metal-dependent hydrolase (beta-lactamase superfamily II)
VFQELGDGVFRRRYETLDLNVGVIIGEEGLLVIDTRSTHSQGDEILAELVHLTPLPVRWVVNSHWHWDHVFGNSRFPDAQIWGHVRTRETLLARPDEMKAGARQWLGSELASQVAEVEIVAPESTFSDRVTIDIGRPVELSYHGPGHTDADIRILVGDARVAFLGDLVEEGAPPAFGDSYPLSWPLTLRLAMEGVEGAVVPGHGDVVDGEFVATQHQELVSVAEIAALVVEGELSVEEAARRGPYPTKVMATALERALVTASVDRAAESTE